MGEHQTFSGHVIDFIANRTPEARATEGGFRGQLGGQNGQGSHT